jgi:hypothetical protein
MNDDVVHQLMLDGNAAAGMLAEIFGTDMTASATECAHCGRAGAIGTLVAFTRAPGTVLRCPACLGIVLRITDTGRALMLDARGAVYLRLAREAG